LVTNRLYLAASSEVQSSGVAGSGHSFGELMSTVAATGAPVAEISPELVLVDPELAERMRPLLGRLKTSGPTALPPLNGDSACVHSVPPAPLADGRSRRVKPNVFPVSFPDNGHFLPSGAPSETLQRLLENTSAPEARELGKRPRRHFGRAARLVPAVSAAAATILLLVQLYLSAGSLS
jgi:hypothetical protein